MKRYRLHRHVHRDLESITAWYDAKQFGVGGEFLEEYAKALERVRENHLFFAEEDESGVRFCPLKRFDRYAIVFVNLESHIHVLSIADLSRDWIHWSSRLPQ